MLCQFWQDISRCFHWLSVIRCQQAAVVALRVVFSLRADTRYLIAPSVLFSSGFAGLGCANLAGRLVVGV